MIAASLDGRVALLNGTAVDRLLTVAEARKLAGELIAAADLITHKISDTPSPMADAYDPRN